MKTFFTFLITLGIFASLSAQEDAAAKHEYARYYNSAIRENASYMKEYTDSTKVIELLNQIEGLTVNIDAELDKVVLPVMEEEIIEVPQIEESEYDTRIEDLDDFTTWTETDNGEDSDSGSRLGLSKYMPFKNKYNTSFDIQFGINSFQTGTESPSGVLSPDINTAGSWYWEFALMRRARLAGKNSKVAVTYGISYLKNRFKIENDVRLTVDGEIPVFVAVADAKENPKLNIGYLNIPLGINFKLAKKTTLKLGGYAGYRVHTVQKFKLKPANETIYENRYGGYELNNWVYGATASLDIAGFDIVAKYNFSKVFKDNPNYDLNTFMIGTSVSLF